MAVLSNLKLVASKKHLTVAPVVQRRNKLIAKIHQQIELCEAQKAGNTYAPKKLRTYTLFLVHFSYVDIQLLVLSAFSVDLSLLCYACRKDS